MEETKRDKEYWRGDDRLLGDSAFVDEVLRTSEDMLSRKELLRKNGWNIEKVISVVCGIFGVKQSDIMLKGRNDAKSKAKAAICCLAYRELGLSGVEIGRRLGITKAAVGFSVRMGEVVVREKGVDLLILQLDFVP